MSEIVTLTMNPALDKSAQVDRVIPEHKLRCTDVRADPGGGGINVARAIRKLGGDAVAFFLSGGPTGELLEKLLEQEGVRHRAIPIREWTRDSLTVSETSTEQQFRFNMPGPNVSAAEWQTCVEELSKLTPAPGFIVLSGSLPPGVPEDFYAKVAKLGAERGSKVVLDTSRGPLRAAMEEGVYLLKPNLRELGQLAGRELLDEDEQESFAGELVAKGKARAVVISMAAAGAVLVTSGARVRLRSPTVKIRSTVGAGDSMVAGMVLALSKGASFAEAARFGVAAGAAAVMTPGTELCRKEDAERLYARIEHS